jgi:predicted ABC-type ATPase
MRDLQGGHDVPSEKLLQRFPRTLANLKLAIRELPKVWIFDNTDLRAPHRPAAIVEDGVVVKLQRPVPKWLATALRNP